MKHTPAFRLTAKSYLIEPQAVVNQNVTQYNVRVEIDNSSPTFRLLRPGMNATCQFIAGSKDSVLNVPNDAVQQDNSGGNNHAGRIIRFKDGCMVSDATVAQPLQADELLAQMPAPDEDDDMAALPLLAAAE